MNLSSSDLAVLVLLDVGVLVLFWILVEIRQHFLLKRVLLLFGTSRLDRVEVERRLKLAEGVQDLHNGRFDDHGRRILSLEKWKGGPTRRKKIVRLDEKLSSLRKMIDDLNNVD